MAAHQPNFIPWLGWFDKLMSSDVLVIRDEVQFVKRDYHHRTQIRIQGYNDEGSPKSEWIRVPVDKSEAHLREKDIRNDVKDRNVPWNTAMLRQIEGAYAGTDYFNEYFLEFKAIINRNHDKLVDLNMDIIKFMMDAYGIKKEIVMASEINGGEKSRYASQDLAELAQRVGANIYLSGSGGRNYLDMEPFQLGNIEVRFQEFQHPVYKQRENGFLPNMAGIDALFNVGKYPNKN